MRRAVRAARALQSDELMAVMVERGPKSSIKNACLSRHDFVYWQRFVSLF
jgi:hypothetical protein